MLHWKQGLIKLKFDAGYSDVAKIFNLERCNIETKLSILHIDIPTNFGKKKWTIEKQTDGPIDYEMSLLVWALRGGQHQKFIGIFKINLSHLKFLN